MNVLVIGSGISAINVAKTFLEYNYKVYLVDSENVLDKKSAKTKRSDNFLPNIDKSPKYNDRHLVSSLEKFKKKYNIKTRNFFLVSGLISGGLSNFWGAGLEIPDANYLKKYKFGKSIMKEQDYVDKELKIDKRKFSFFNFFYNQKIIKKMLKKKDKSIFFSKLLLGVEHYNKKKLSIKDYDNVDLLGSFNDRIYNSKLQLYNLISKKNFYYIPNTFVKSIKKKKNYVLFTDKKKKINLKFNKIIISCGTVGSTILVDRILNSSDKYRLFHTPILKLMYFTFSLPFKIKNSIKFGLPILNLNIQNKKHKFSGSFMYLDNISNFFLGFSKFNILFSFIKKFFFVGNIFLPPEYSNTYIDVQKKKVFIHSTNRLDKKELILMLKKKLNSFLSKFNLFEFSPQNLKFLQNGSDAHYTSTLINKEINGDKILNYFSELKNFKNIYVIDGSSIKEGLHYPTYFLMLYARFISKKIISNDKKNKNKY